ncbi:hypothetical protein BCR44DRAFT_40520 [Catenaria anguillulae PL171]|uniref:Polynucleotide adenylyltransferase n=1 Tax=Catenaria anguillulae PL171 TaxID=765915 RepID=A0A1Y2I1N9_9FUNG|nr:hypothetical protein BCR44DRAFT_40520 [Catenaria anguillulae PL171]
MHPGPSRAWNTALCLIPPPSLWPTFQRLRHTLDPANAKWPPHINLLYPFTAADADLTHTAHLIQSAIAPLFSPSESTPSSSNAIRIQLRTRPTPYIRGKSAKVSAEPLDPAPLVRLHDALHAVFPHFTRTNRYGPFSAHLNVALAPWNPGQPKQTQAYLDQILAAVKSLLDSDDHNSLVEWEAFGLYVLLREDDSPFSFAAYVPFTAAGDWQDPYGLVGSTWNSDLYAPDFSCMHQNFIGVPGETSDAVEDDSDAMAVDGPPPYKSDSVPIWQGELYPFISSPDQLAIDPACDEAWVRLPSFHFDSNVGDWVPATNSQLDATYAHPDIPASLSLLTYNIFSDGQNPNTPNRLPLIVAELERQHLGGVFIINLQECTPEFLAILLATPWVRKHYSVTHTLEWATAMFPHVGSPVTLVRGPTPFAHMHVRYSGAKSSLCVQIPSWKAMVANVHLTSSHSSNGADPASRRCAQMEPIGRLMKQHAPEDWLVAIAGDFNTPSSEEEDSSLLGRHGLVDSVQLLGGKCLPTFNPARNPLAGYSPCKVPVGIDRVVVRAGSGGGAWVPVNQGLVGTENPASDHYGLLVSFMSHPQSMRFSPTQPPPIPDERLHQLLCHNSPHEFDSRDQLCVRAASLDSVSAFCIRSLSHLPYARHIAALIPIDLVRYGPARPRDSTQAVWFVDMEPKAALGHLLHLNATAASSSMQLDHPVRILGHSPCPWSPSAAITVHFQTSPSDRVNVHIMDPGVQIHTLAHDLLLNPDSRAHQWPVATLKRSVMSAVHPVREANDLAAHLNRNPSIRLAYRILRHWAETNGIVSSSPTSVHLTPTALLILLVRTAAAMLPDTCAASLLRAFFDDYATFPFASLAIAINRYPTTRTSNSSTAMVVESVCRPGVNMAANVCASSRDAFVDAVRRQRALDQVPGMLADAQGGWQRFSHAFPEFVIVSIGWYVMEEEEKAAARLRSLHLQDMVNLLGVSWAKVMAAAEKAAAEQEAHVARLQMWPAACVEARGGAVAHQVCEVHYAIGVRSRDQATVSTITAKVAGLVHSVAGGNVAGAVTWWNRVRSVLREDMVNLVPLTG